MAFLNATTLAARVVTRLRQVSGTGTQLYADDVILQLLEETYEMVRSQRWWDHLTGWQTRQLDGTTGLCTVGFAGAREGYSDVQGVYIAQQSAPLPLLSSNINPYRYNGTEPRYVEPLQFSENDDDKLFRIWPLTATTSVDRPLRVRVRLDPANIFRRPNIEIPFDATVLINGAAAKYAADDGANAAQVAVLERTFGERLRQLERQHDNATIILDPRMNGQVGLTEWTEEWR